MPINGIGSLADVVDGYQQGVEWKQQRVQQERARQQQMVADEANKAAGSVIDASKAEWAMNGAQGTYTPNDDTMLKAAQARGDTFAKGGDWENYFKNDALVQSQRHRIRANAVQQVMQDGDVPTLIRKVYPTIFNGKDVTDVEQLPGGEPNALKGAPSGGPMLRVKLSDGTTQLISPADAVARVKQTLIDPQAQAEQEAKMHYLLVQERIKGDEARKTEGTKGEQARKTEGVKHTGALEIAGIQGERARDVAKIGADATLGSAGIHRDGVVQAAEIGRDGRIAVAEAKAVAKDGGGDSPAAAKSWQDLAVKNYGQVAGGLFGSSRMGGQSMVDLSSTAQRIHEANKGKLTRLQALDQAAKFLKLKSPPIGLDAVNATAGEE
jgi:hypothetical protein